MPHPTTTQTFLMAALVAAVFALPGCKRASEVIAEKAIERASGNKVDIQRKGESLSIKTDEGELKVATAGAGGSVALPEGFPTDVHLPARRTINSAMEMAGMKMVNLQTPASPGEVSADVEKSMQGQGWKREMSMQASGGSTLVYSKDQRQAVFQILQADSGGGTQMAVRTGTGG